MNIFSKTLLILLISSYSLTAEGWEVDAGAGLWSGSADGSIVHQVSSDLFDLTIPDQQLTDNLGRHEDSMAGYLYIALRHPIPILPNFRFEYVGVNAAGEIDYLDDKEFLGGIVDITADTQLFLTQYDSIFFYNLLDKKFWMTFDLGVDLKYVTTQYYVPDLGVDETSGSLVPMLYLLGRVDMPSVPLGFETDIKYITDGESTVYDVSLKVDYTFEMNAALQPGIELGYRLQKFKVDGEDSTYLSDIFSWKSDTDVNFAGFYGGITVKF